MTKQETLELFAMLGLDLPAAKAGSKPAVVVYRSQLDLTGGNKPSVRQQKERSIKAG